MKKQFLQSLYSVVPGRFKQYLQRKIVSMEGGQMYSDFLRQLFKIKYGINIGYGSYGGCFNTRNLLPPNVNFGNYCSVAQNIRIFRANHPKNTFTTHPLLYNPIAGFVKADMLNRPKLDIGHDVWIGEGTIILPSVLEIGNGAIIGAGSIVTKNVAPYTIVAGNPAKVLGKRFDDHVIKLLEESQWWLMNKEELIKYIPNLDKLVNYDISN